ncbi:UNVERIFIED_CONTAM: hypothetical protein Sradi_6033500 [Sesamum radiatum]|uniref:ATP-dependent DNA helicase n=1 Tax=Sesamum radiatum TaxID=300843 RepID=A0AAW2KIA7_SESRA
MYKYTYKGIDMATIVIENNADNPQNNGEHMYRHVDEIKQYLDCRYVSAIEACWRIYEFELQKQYPSVERLQYHLPNEQFVVFNEDDHLYDVVNRNGVQDTMLTKWFEANKKYPVARTLTYVQFPTAWVWKRDKKQWEMRKKGKCIGRLPYAHPNSGEKYYLRMLLYKVCGAECHKDIRTFEGSVYPTFKQACSARGLLDDDNEWHEALSEASSWASPIKLRNMFCTMLMFSEITDSFGLWERHWRVMTDDLQYRLRRELRDNSVHISDENLKEWGLHEIECILNRNGKTLGDFPPMPLPSSRSFGIITNRLIREELDYDSVAEEQSFRSYFNGLNNDQLRVFNAIIQAYERKCGGLFFVNGSGGTGKTYLWKTIIAKFRSQNKVVLSVASSGIAALLLPGGRTAHSRFKIPFELVETSHCPINLNTDLAHLIQEASLIIWDEAPMMHRYGFEAVSKTLKDLLKQNENFSAEKPFGGKLCILGGDFKQILPVVTKGRRESIVAASLHKSDIWSQCQVMHLKMNMRLNAQNDSTQPLERLRSFAEWIDMIGEGKIRSLSFPDSRGSDWIEIPEEFLIEHGDNSLLQLIDSTYPQLGSMYSDAAYLKERAILAPKNSDVDVINSMMLSMIPGEVRQFCSADTLCPGETSVCEQHESSRITTFNKDVCDTRIEKASEQNDDFLRNFYHIVRLKDTRSYINFDDQLIDIFGLVICVTECRLSPNGLLAREIVLLDTTMTAVRLVLCGRFGMEEGETLLRTINQNNIVLACGVVVRDLEGQLVCESCNDVVNATIRFRVQLRVKDSSGVIDLRLLNKQAEYVFRKEATYFKDLQEKVFSKLLDYIT